MTASFRAVDRTLLSKNRLLGQLDPPMLEELLTLSRIERFAPKNVIFQKGDPGDSLYAIASGRVGITTISEEGKEIFLNFLDAGEVFGEIALLDGKERTAGAIAMEPTELLGVRRADFLPLLERDPKLCIRLMIVLCERIRWTSDIIEDTIFLDIPRRLAKRLLTLVEQYGESADAGIRIKIKLSQEHLAQMLGVTRESVNKGIRLLEGKGIIIYKKGYIIVTNRMSLEKFLGASE